MTVNKLSLPAKENAVQLKINEIIDNLGGGGTATDVQINGTSITSNYVANIVTNTAYNASSNKMATMSDVPSVDSALSSTSTNPVQNKVITTALNNKQGTISDLSTIRSGASAGATAVQPDDLATVATSGNYNDLTNKPTIPTVNNATLTIQKNGTTVKTFTANASSNVTANITVPTKTSELTNDSGYTSNVGTVTKVNNTSPDSSGNVTLSIPAAQIQSDWNQTTTTAKDYIKNKPTIPSVGNATITITQGGTTKGSFTTNQSSNATIALDAGGGSTTTVKINGTSITSSGVADIKTNGTYNSSSNKIATMSDLPTVPTNISSFTNDSGYITGISSSDVTTALGYTPTTPANVDGQFTAKRLTIDTTTSKHTTTSNLGTTGTSPLSYLPADCTTYDYLVIGSMYGTTTSNTPTGWVGNVTSPATATNGIYAEIIGDASNRRPCIQFIIPVTNGMIYTQVYNSAFSNNFGVVLTGYRRIGTNT